MSDANTVTSKLAHLLETIQLFTPSRGRAHDEIVAAFDELREAIVTEPRAAQPEPQPQPEQPTTKYYFVSYTMGRPFETQFPQSTITTLHPFTWLLGQQARQKNASLITTLLSWREISLEEVRLYYENGVPDALLPKKEPQP